MVIKKITLGTTLAMAAGLFGTQLHRVFADGAPDKTKEPLVYSGVLEDGDTPVSGARNARITLYSDKEMIGVDVTKCITEAPNTNFLKGRFRIVLDASCSDAVAANPDLWVGLEVQGTIFSRRKLGAVAYAREASHATNATTASGTAGDLSVKFAALQARTDCPDPTAPTKYGFCIWHDNNGKSYTQTYFQAAATCRAKGARLCTTAEVSAAQAAGAEWCAHSWVADRIDSATAYHVFPMQSQTPGCGHLGLTVVTSVMTGKYDANCCKP